MQVTPVISQNPTPDYVNIHNTSFDTLHPPLRPFPGRTFLGRKEAIFTMTIRGVLAVCVASVAFAGFVSAHGGGAAHQKPIQVDSDADWATKHMAGKL